MGVQVSSLILSALQRAVAEPAGLALVSSRSAPGLFTATAAGKQAAQRCKEDGLVRVVRTETKGKTPLEICALTERGLKHLIDETSPRPVLEAILHGIERCEAKLRDLVGDVAHQQEFLESLRTLAVKLLEQTSALTLPTLPAPSNGQPRPEELVVASLRAWQAAGQLGDCPLPELRRRVLDALPKLTIGQFHDAVRSLHDQQTIYLHPWTGPLYEMPEPAVALMTGHEVAYYASLRGADSSSLPAAS